MIYGSIRRLLMMTVSRGACGSIGLTRRKRKVSDRLAHVWAKSPSPGAQQGEPLAGHTANVLARLASWRARYPQLPKHTSCPDYLWDIAAWACLLHDVGKVARGFQTMLRDGPRFPHRHEVLSLVAVGWLD